MDHADHCHDAAVVRRMVVDAGIAGREQAGSGHLEVVADPSQLEPHPRPTVNAGGTSPGGKARRRRRVAETGDRIVANSTWCAAASTATTSPTPV